MIVGQREPGVDGGGARAPGERRAVRLALHAMGTRFELVVHDPLASEAALRAIGEAALDEVRLWHDRLSRFQPDSLVSRINREACARPALVDPETFDLLSLCARVWAASGGAFDPAMGARMDDGQGRAGGAAGFDAVSLNARARTVFLSRPVVLDLGAIAKGYALDRAADVLRAHGVERAFLHGGTSSAIAIGSPPRGSAPPDARSARGRAWRILVRSDGEPLEIGLRDGAALGVSAPRGRTIEVGGAARAHILDPRLGVGCAGTDTAAVVGASAAECDAWSTALVVLGERPGDMPRRLTSMIHDVRGWRIDDPAGARGARPRGAPRDAHRTTEAA